MGYAVLVTLVLVLLVLLYRYLTSTFSYWRDKGVPYVRPYPLVGSMGRVMTLREHFSEFYVRVGAQFPDQPCIGYFRLRQPALLVKDPELVKHILVKDFAHFVNHGVQVDEKQNPLQAKNLFNMENERWREMRAKLTPTFTSGRMRAMFPLVLACAQNLEKHLHSLAECGGDVDIKDVLARYTTDVIGSCAFGVQCDSLADPECQFRVMGRKIFQSNYIFALKRLINIFAPKLFKLARLSTTRPGVTSFFRGMVSEVMAQRKRPGAEPRHDFMQLLMEIQEKGRLTQQPDAKPGSESAEQEEHKQLLAWSQDDVVAQAMVFFIAGFETSSSALTFALLELSWRPDLQRKARAHIEEVLARHGGHVTYQALHDMTYLDWILQEALRKYPPTPMLMRVCTRNYVLPGSGVTVEQGTSVFIPIYAMHNDPVHFPDPERFEPERFSTPEQLQRMQYLYMPFGEGPRQCIAMRFARLQSKLALISCLRALEVRPCDRSPRLPLRMDPRQFLLTPKQNIIVTFAPSGTTHQAKH